MTATVNLSPLPKMRFTDTNGNPLVGGKVFTYAAGTTTKQNTYTDSTGATPNANPVILDSRGEAPIWLDQTLAYKFTLAPATDTDPPTAPIWTIDNIPFSNALAVLLAGTTTLSQGAGAVGFNPTLNYVAGTIGQHLAEQISPTSFPWNAKFDDATDDGAAIQACLTFAATKKLHVVLPSAAFKHSVPLVIPTGVIVSGAGSGGYTALTGASAGGTIGEYTAATGSAWTVGIGAILQDLQVRPSNYAAVVYSVANYPAATGNAPYGVTVLESGWAINVTAIGFSTANFFVPVNNPTAEFIRCEAFNGAINYLIQSTDGTMLDCVSMFANGTAGIDASGGGAFWKFISNRIEWNARNGLICGPENVVTGNIFDRNGWEGLVGFDGNWGQSWTGNYFSRNGCGGELSASATSCTIAGTVLTVGGTVTGAFAVGQVVVGVGLTGSLTISSLGTGTGGAGTYNLSGSATISTAQVISGAATTLCGRWGFSTPSDPSFVPTTIDHSAHIRFGFMRGLVIVGNRFRHGQSDANDGMDGPANIYTVDGANLATTVADVRIWGNAGDQLDAVPGMNAAAYGGLGAIANGTDTSMASYLQNGFALGPSVLQTNIIKGQTPVGASSTTLVVPVPKSSAGHLTVRPVVFNSANVATVYWATNAVGTGYTANFTNNIGTAVTGAALTAGAAGSAFDTLTITFGASYFATAAGICS